jgi:DNA-binding response OmpR family regulator
MVARPIRILLVEDEKEERISFTLILEMAGYSVVPTQTGRQALEELNMDSFQAAMVDLHLEDLTAFDLIPQIRSLQPTTQIIILTAEIREEYQ